MKARNVAALALLAGGAFFASTGVALAADETSSCADGLIEQVADDGSVSCVDPQSQEFVVNDIVATSDDVSTPTEGSCWVNEDGTNACARGGVLTSEPMPIDATNCVYPTDTSTNNQDVSDPSANNPVAFACDAVAYNVMPQTDDAGNPIGIDENTPVLYKADGIAAPAGLDSNTMAALGVLVAALGAGAIGFKNSRLTK